MHARQLVEVAGLIGLRSSPLLHSEKTLCSDALSEYWIASRCRLDDWGRRLRALGHSQSAPPPDASGDLLTRLAEELTLTEPLTRVVAAICHAYDRVSSADEAGAIGRNTLDAHRQTTSRLRALTFAWWANDSPRTRHVKSLVTQAEHWTDVLLAYVSLAADVEHLACDPARVREFAYDSQLHGTDASNGASQLLLYALQTSFVAARQPPLNSVLNRRIAGAAIALFGEGGFDGHGLVRPAWMLRAERTADDAATLVERLFADENTPPASRLPERWRI